MKSPSTFLVTITAALVFFSCSSEPKTVENASMASDKDSIIISNPALTKKAADLRVEMRRLWGDQITWTRNSIYCLVDDLPGGAQAEQRLLKNQEEFGDLLRNYYEPKTCTRIVDLLKDNVNLAADAIRAVNEKDTRLLSLSNRKWFANADSVAVILSSENPNYGMGELKLMLHEHLKHITDVATARAKKDYDGDVRSYDIASNQAMKLSDVLTDGIIHHFPEKFSATSQPLTLRN